MAFNKREIESVRYWLRWLLETGYGFGKGVHPLLDRVDEELAALDQPAPTEAFDLDSLPADLRAEYERKKAGAQPSICRDCRELIDGHCDGTPYCQPVNSDGNPRDGEQWLNRVWLCKDCGKEIPDDGYGPVIRCEDCVLLAELADEG